MEHKLILGGEQYLPFARSRIKALRASGMQYATQKFVMPEGEVEVRIVGDQSYIRLTGGDYEVLSGVVRDGELVALPIPEGSPEGTEAIKTLRDYKPTAQAWQYPLKSDPEKSPSMFSDEKKLATKAHENTGLDTEESQYDKLSASMYSGLMAKAVQIIMGYSKKAGVKVKYDHRWARCHGIAIGEDGAKWLVEISFVNGVVAMPFPVAAGTAKFSTSAQDVLREAVTLFGGLPSGKLFPTDLDAALTSGTVLRLMTVADMDSVFLKSTFSPLLGWAFSPLGNEAQNTCYRTSGDDVISCRYKLAITIGPKIADRPENTPLAVATAVLTLEEEGPLTRKNGTGGRIPFAFAWDRDGLLAEVPAKFVTSDPVATSAPLLVTYDKDGVLDVVKFEVIPAQTPTDVNTHGDECDFLGYTRPGNWRNRVLTSIGGGRTISSTKYPTEFGTTGTISTEYSTKAIAQTKVFYASVLVTEFLFSASIFDLVEFHRLYYTTEVTYVSRTIPAIAGVWPLGARDGYVLNKPEEERWSYFARSRNGEDDPDDAIGGEGNWYFTYRNATAYQYAAVNASSFPTLTVAKYVRSDGNACQWNYVGSSDFASEGLMATTDWYAEIAALPTLASLPAVDWPALLSAGPPVTDPQFVRVVTPFETITKDTGENDAGVWRSPPPVFNAQTSYAVRFSTFGPNPQLTFSYSILGYLHPGVERVGSMLATEADPAQHTYSFVGYI